MLYPKNSKPLSPELFADPTGEYRGTPFWAWNSSLEEEELLWQIEILKSMGFGGFHMHVRTGMATPYLSEEFFHAVKACVEKAKQEKMLSWLYDEDRWPSGAAGGFVTKNPAYRSRHLLLTRVPYGNGGNTVESYDSSARSGRTENGALLACFDVSLGEDGSLVSYRRIAPQDSPQGFLLYAYEETMLPSPWYNNQTYVNTLDPKAIQKFLEVTHESYLREVGADFGSTIPAIFTDEPQFSHKETLSYAHEAKDITLPWTGDFPDTYQGAYGEDILDSIPELLWDLPHGAPSLTRYRYHDHIAERFSQAFADQCGSWCAKNNIMLTGHMMEEPTLESQTAALGEAMRSYRSFHLPGIDMLDDNREFTTAKQAQSAARQYGCPGVLSELYGVTNWNFDFRGYKLQGDWQAALGVTVRVPHLSWVSMNGEAKRDYPSTFQYQSPWHREFPVIENHFARVNTAMTRGKAVSRVGVIHPIESYWLHWGPRETTADIRSAMDSNFQNLTKWLLESTLDFDFISESLLPDLCDPKAITKASFPVGKMNYEVILVPGMETIRRSTLERLRAFRSQGGRVVFLGKIPALVDAVSSRDALVLSQAAEIISFEKLSILQALSDVRDVEIRREDGSRTENILYQLREEEHCRWLFLAHGDECTNPDIPDGKLLHIKIRGEYGAELYNTLSGEIQELSAEVENGWTVLSLPFYDQDSILLRLAHDMSSFKDSNPSLTNTAREGSLRFLQPVPVTLHEPNVLLLDMARYALDDGPLRPVEEILRLDQGLRKELHWPLRGEAVAQPWLEQNASPSHRLRLEFSIICREPVKSPRLALENARLATVLLNGAPAAPTREWYVDKCMGIVELPDLHPGENLLEITLLYGPQIDVEACYLLGRFGVQIAGTACTLTREVTALAFGDITRQGLPFYGGNITYHLEVPDTPKAISASCYRGQLIKAELDGQAAGSILFSPYELDTSQLEAGCKKLDLTYFGTRINTFGQLHCLQRRPHNWWGPNSWRTQGAEWSYEYQLWPQGILKSPEVFY